MERRESASVAMVCALCLAAGFLLGRAPAGGPGHDAAKVPANDAPAGGGSALPAYCDASQWSNLTIPPFPHQAELEALAGEMNATNAEMEALAGQMAGLDPGSEEWSRIESRRNELANAQTSRQIRLQMLMTRINQYWTLVAANLSAQHQMMMTCARGVFPGG